MISIKYLTIQKKKEEETENERTKEGKEGRREGRERQGESEGKEMLVFQIGLGFCIPAGTHV